MENKPSRARVWFPIVLAVVVAIIFFADQATPSDALFGVSWWEVGYAMGTVLFVALFAAPIVLVAFGIYWLAKRSENKKES
jgi:uncharacterized membrane protein YfbV (UPF0208 family)